MDKSILRIFFFVVVFINLAVVHMLSEVSIINFKNEFILTSVILTIYLLGEVYLLYLKDGIISITTPAAIVSLTHFFVAFCISNSLLLNGEHYTSYLYTYEYLIKAQYLVIFSSMLFWIGYKAKIGALVAIFIKRINLIKNLYSFNNSLNVSNLFAIFVISIGFQLIGLKLGIYGYADASQINNSIIYASFSQYIQIVIGLSTLMLGALAIEFYSDVKNKKMKFYLNISVITLIIMGFVLGMKGGVIMPILNIIIAKLIVQKKIDMKFIIIGFIMLTIAYLIVGNYREILRNSNNSISRMQAIQLSVTLSKDNKSQEHLVEMIFDRLNETKDLAASMYYKDNHTLGSDDPKFLTSIMVAPISSFIPRTIWQSKPMETYGLWYSKAVYGIPSDIYTSTKMSIEGFFYFAGGKIGVLLGMFTLGVLMKFIYEFLKPRNKSDENSTKAYYLLYLNFLPLFMYLDTPTSFLSNLIRYFFIYALVIKVIYKKG